MDPRRLYRSRTDRVIGGVCGGLAQFFTIDATIIRLLFVFTALFGGTSLLVYLVMLLVVPEEPLPKDDVIDAAVVETASKAQPKKK
jgi:phage shock protein PspC (stress-responsive transcriptional regulator)